MKIFEGFFVAIASIINFFHSIYSKIFGFNSGYTWGFSIISLVILIRLLLVPLFIKQMQSTMTMQKLYPKIKEIKEEYKYDKKEQQMQIMNLYKEHNANPFMGCLPILIQSPFFLSLFRVLESISKWTVNNHTTLYGPFRNNTALVESAQHARIFGAPISIKMFDSHEKYSLMHSNIAYARITIAVMIMIIVAIQVISQKTMMKLQSTYVNAPNQSGEQQTVQKIQQKFIMYIMPFATILFGINMSTGVLLYWIISYSWTFGQQSLMMKFLYSRKSKEDRQQNQKKG